MSSRSAPSSRWSRSRSAAWWASSSARPCLLPGCGQTLVEGPRDQQKPSLRWRFWVTAPCCPVVRGSRCRQAGGLRRWFSQACCLAGDGLEVYRRRPTSCSPTLRYPGPGLPHPRRLRLHRPSSAAPGASPCCWPSSPRHLLAAVARVCLGCGWSCPRPGSHPPRHRGRGTGRGAGRADGRRPLAGPYGAAPAGRGGAGCSVPASGTRSSGTWTRSGQSSPSCSGNIEPRTRSTCSTTP